MLRYVILLNRPNTLGFERELVISTVVSKQRFHVSHQADNAPKGCSWFWLLLRPDLWMGRLLDYPTLL